MTGTKANLVVGLDINVSIDLKPLAIGFGISFTLDPKLELEMELKLGTGPGNISPIDAPIAMADAVPNYTLVGRGKISTGGVGTILKFTVGGEVTSVLSLKKVSKKIEAGVNQ